MNGVLRVHPEGIRETIRRLRAWRVRWDAEFRNAQREGLALIRAVHAVPGRGFEETSTAQQLRLSQVGERVERLARVLEQALARLETAFYEAARRVEAPERAPAGERLPTAAVAATFEEAYAFIRKWEGGYVNHPDDPGGPTNLGITQGTYDAYRQRHGLPLQDVGKITPAEAEAIYREMFWEASGAERLPRPLGLVHMDTAVNMGPGRARAFLEEAQRRHPDDPNAAMRAYLDLRLNRYFELAEQHPSQRQFLNGWLNRLVDLAGYAAPGEGFAEAFYRKVRDQLSARAAEDPAYQSILERFRNHWKGYER